MIHISKVFEELLFWMIFFLNLIHLYFPFSYVIFRILLFNCIFILFLKNHSEV